jgi:hypothetical protein
MCVASERRLLADEAFSYYDFGDMQIKDTGSWLSDKNEWSMPIFIENGTNDSIRLVFIVRFKNNCDDVEEAYVSS